MNRIFLVLSLLAFAIVGMGVAINGELEKALFEKLATDPTGTAAVEGRVYYNTAEKKAKVHNGTNFVGLGSGGGTGINYIENHDFESTADGSAPSDWSTYADAAASDPADGTGGSANITFLGEDTSPAPLRGSISAVFTKDAVNRQGEGVSYDFTLDKADTDSAKVLQISFDYDTSANYETDDITVHVYNKDTTALVEGVSGSIAAGTASFAGTFSTDGSSDDYRVILHIASTNASAYTVTLENFVVGPKDIIAIPDPRWPSYTESEVVFTSTQSGFAVDTSNFVPYQTSNGNWRLKFNLTGTYTSATISSIKVTIPNITTVNNTQAIAGTISTVSNITDVEAIYIGSSSGDCVWRGTSSGNTTQINFSGDVALASKPDWATKTAPDVYLAGSVNVDEVGALAFATGSQVISDNTEGSVNFTISPAEEDTHNGWTSTDTYTVPFDGKYIITALILENANMLASGTASLEVRINGSTDYTIDYWEQQSNNTSQNIALKGAIRLPLSKDDTIELRARIDTNGVNWTPESGSYISITKIPSPQEVANAALTFSQATEDRPGLVYKGVAVSDAAGATPSKAEFDALLDSLRDAGIIAE